MPDDQVYVFDACAVIAFLHDEAGSDVVEQLLARAGVRVVIHAINACEVYYDLLRRGNEDDADALEGILEVSGIEVAYSFSAALWKPAGRLKAEWRRISLADCMALALAIQNQATLVTSDHHEFDRIAEADLCPCMFIR